MSRLRLDTSLERIEIEGFAFPLGVRPVEPLSPRPGCVVEFEPSDGGVEGEWEEWPDRYAFDIVITATRLEPLCRSLFSLLPSRVYPILDVMGIDAHREVDPFIAYELVGFDRFIEEVSRRREWFYEDGLVGFGAMSVDPFIYIFIDEHKIVTVRAQVDLRERVEEILAAFDLPLIDEPLGVDSVMHEHRGLLVTAPGQPEFASADLIIEELIDVWKLRLNVDRSVNQDDEGVELGVTGFRCLVRHEPDAGAFEYFEIALTASCLDEAEHLAFEAAAESISPSASAITEDDVADDEGAEDRHLEWAELTLISADRLTREDYKAFLKEAGVEVESDAGPLMQESGVHFLRRLKSS